MSTLDIDVDELRAFVDSQCPPKTQLQVAAATALITLTGTLHINAVNEVDLDGWWDVAGYNTEMTSVGNPTDGWSLVASGSLASFAVTHRVSQSGNGLRCDEYRWTESLDDVLVGTCTLSKR